MLFRVVQEQRKEKLMLVSIYILPMTMLHKTRGKVSFQKVWNDNKLRRKQKRGDGIDKCHLIFSLQNKKGLHLPFSLTYLRFSNFHLFSETISNSICEAFAEFNFDSKIRT